MKTNYIVVGTLATSFLLTSVAYNSDTQDINYYTDSITGFSKNKVKTASDMIITEEQPFTLESAEGTKITIIEQNPIDVVIEFASAIVKNCKPLNSEFSKFVDDNFWDLI